MVLGLVGAVSNDGSEYSVYIYKYIYGHEITLFRIDNSGKCNLSANNYGSVSVSNPTDGKTYHYYKTIIFKANF